MVNRVIGRRLAKKQPMRWRRRGAHLLVQIRVAMLHRRLPQAFQRWFPVTTSTVTANAVAAISAIVGNASQTANLTVTK
jgi:hypothetical protein